MNKILNSLLIPIIYLLVSCNNVDPNTTPAENKDPVTSDSLNITYTTNWQALTKDFMTWYNYTYNNVRLSAEFTGLDVDSLEINKTAFLNKLLSGNVVAYKIKIIQGKPVYKLFKLNSDDQSIRSTIKQMALTEMEHFKMEGNEIPEFNFTDLNGNTYNKQSTNGKILVLKCWFIHCVACVKEFPELNNLVDEYKNRNDVLFISLAMDAGQDLRDFLKTKEFKYAVIPGMKNYMVEKLKVSQFPTHLLIDKNGKIVKVVNRIKDLIPYLKKV